MKTLEMSFLLFFHTAPSLKAIPSPRSYFMPDVIISSFGYMAVLSGLKNYLRRSGLMMEIVIRLTTFDIIKS